MAFHNLHSRPSSDVTDSVLSLSIDADNRDTSFINQNCKHEIKENCDKYDNDIDESLENTTHDPAHDSGYHTGNTTPPEVPESKKRLRNSGSYGSSDLFGKEISQNNSQKIESSAESFTERFLRSGTWPLAEGSDRVYFSTSNDISTENTHLLRTNENTSRQSSKEKVDDKSESTEDGKGFSLKTLSRDQKVILIATSFTNLLSFLSLSVLAPFFPIEADKKGVNSTISGWIFGIFALVQFLTSPLFGRILPIVGCRFMYISGLFMCGGCTLLFGVLDRVDTSDNIVVFVTLCFVTRILLSLGCTGLSNAGFVLLVKYFPDSVATVFGIGEVFTGIGMVTGPALGGFLYATLPGTFGYGEGTGESLAKKLHTMPPAYLIQQLKEKNLLPSVTNAAAA